VLIDTYRWSDQAEEVAFFVLTGVPPRAFAGQISYAPPPASTDVRNGMIAMYVSARLGPRDVMELYGEYRRDLLSGETRVRDISERAGRLALFAAQVNDGRSWPAAMAAWNSQRTSSPDYHEKRLFARDCRSAYKRVMGKELAWRGVRGRQAQSQGLQPGGETFEEIARQHWERLARLQRRQDERREARRKRRAQKEE
jgi:hypothetical protein